MGSGKTTLGRQLALKQNKRFIDTDAEIEQLYNMSCRRIIEQYGIDHFRSLENQLLLDLIGSDLTDTIIATGGGMSCNNSNIKLMKQHGTVVYLKWTALQIATSLSAEDIKARPRLQNLNPKQLLEFITKDLEQREQYYLQADVII